MKAEEFDNHIGGAIRAAFNSNIHPAIVYTILQGYSVKVMQVIQTPPPPDNGQPPGAPEPPSNIILPPSMARK